MILFSKYHGLGNDFILVNQRDIQTQDPSILAQRLCDRHTGIGADGLIIVRQEPLEMVYYNSDGSRAKMCGNGIRCFANYVVDHNLSSSKVFPVQTLAGEYLIEILNTDPFNCKVNMGTPTFTASQVPVVTEQETFINQQIEVHNKHYTVTSLFMGTIHTALEVDDLSTIDMTAIGKAVQSLSIYPDSTNVNFYQVIDQSTIKMQTYERGAGLTLACGTGATAVYSVLHHVNHINHPVTVQLPLGDLTLEVDEQNNIYMTGPAQLVFTGTYVIERS